MLQFIIMATKSSIERNQKRETLSRKYYYKRIILKQKLRLTSSISEKWYLQSKLQCLPRNSSLTRVYRRCAITGRPRAVYRDFGLSRHVLREMAHMCLLTGVTKASW
jgi:small subunit ribosomal protein S14